MKEKKEAKKAWDKIRDENSKKMYKEKKNKAVTMAKARAYKDLYARLETKKVKKSCTDWLGKDTERGKMYSK